MSDSVVDNTKRRIWIGRDADGAAMLLLADAKERKRLVLHAAAASVAVYVADGKNRQSFLRAGRFNPSALA